MNIQCKIISIFLYTNIFQKTVPQLSFPHKTIQSLFFFSEVSEELKMKYETCEISDV